MIELLWKDIRDAQNITTFVMLKYMNDLISWLYNGINEKFSDTEKETTVFEGFLAITKRNSRAAFLLFTEGEMEQKILELLQQPPDEYKGKYCARIIIGDECEDEGESSDEEFEGKNDEAG